MRDRVRSKSSTSCWKVGLWDGTACQQSLIIRYLKEQKTVFRQETWRRGIQIFYLSYSNATVISKHSPFVSPRGHQINLRGRQTINGTGQKKSPETTTVSDFRIFIKSFFYVVVSTNFTIYERRQHFNDATCVLQIIYKLPLQNMQFSELLSWRHFIIFVKLCLWLVLHLFGPSCKFGPCSTFLCLCKNSQILRAGGGFLHAMSLLQQLEELLHRDSGVRRPSEGEDFPQQDSKRPPAAAAAQRRHNSLTQGMCSILAQ